MFTVSSPRMETPLSAIIAVLVFLACVTSWVTHVEAGPQKQEPEAPAKGAQKAKAEKWVVVRVGVGLQVVCSTEVKSLKLKADRAYKEELAAWALEKKEAKARKEAFATARPKKPKWKVVSKAFASEADANSAKAKLVEKAEKKKQKAKRPEKPKNGKKPAKGTSKNSS